MSAIWYSLTAKTWIFKTSFEIGIKVMPGGLSTLQRRQQIFLGWRKLCSFNCYLGKAFGRQHLGSLIWDWLKPVCFYQQRTHKSKLCSSAPVCLVMWASTSAWKLFSKELEFGRWRCRDHRHAGQHASASLARPLWGWGRYVAGSHQYALSFQIKWEELSGFPSGKW